MAAHVREVHLHRKQMLGSYAAVGRGEAVRRVRELGDRVCRQLGTRRVFMVSSTEHGGGVAELLPHLALLLNELGVHTRWLVLEPDDPRFFEVTKQLHNMVHGEAGVDDPAGAHDLYERVSREASESLRQAVDPGDVVVIHDPQPLGAGCMLPEEYRRRLWRCHIGVTFANEHTDAAWTFLGRYLEPYRRVLFSVERYVPASLRERAGVLTPGIDALSHKNRPLRPYKLVGILRAAGLVDGPPVQEWARFDVIARRYREGRWREEPIPNLLYAPLVLQVSRFDRLKGFHTLIPAFERLLDLYPERVAHLKADEERAVSELGAAELLLVGPDPSGVSDDPEADAVLGELCAQHDALADDVAKRVHLVRTPMVDAKQNALIINALQRTASVIVQASLQEGFGLTVTEAMWKGVPVVASNVGGIGVQVRHEVDGLLVDDPSDTEALAEALLLVLGNPARLETMGTAAHERVLGSFLMLDVVERWLQELAQLLE